MTQNQLDGLMSILKFVAMGTFGVMGIMLALYIFKQELVVKHPLIVGTVLQLGGLLSIPLTFLYGGVFGLLGVSLALYIWGIVVVMKSGAVLTIRIILGFWPMILLGALIAINVFEDLTGDLRAYYFGKIPAEVFLIPAEYHGSVNVFLDNFPAALPEYEGDKLVFRIPPDGVLSTKVREVVLSPKRQLVRRQIREYYAVDPAGRRVRLGLCRDDTPPDQICVADMYWPQYKTRIRQINLFVGKRAEIDPSVNDWAKSHEGQVIE